MWRQGLEIDIRAMAAAGAESVNNGGCGPDDTLYLVGDPDEDRPRVEKFINRLHETSNKLSTIISASREACQPSAKLVTSVHTELCLILQLALWYSCAVLCVFTAWHGRLHFASIRLAVSSPNIPAASDS